MGIKLGQLQINSMFLGSKPINKVYYGQIQIYSNQPTVSAVSVLLQDGSVVNKNDIF